MTLQMVLRYPVAAARARRRPPIELLDESRLELRVHPTDCDSYLHVNNGRYLTLMDLGRIDYVGRCGLARAFREQGWKPVATGATIRFRRELRMFTRYALTTRLVGWNEDWWFFEQRFDRADGALAARAFAKIAVLDGDGRRLSPVTALDVLGLPSAPPELPADLVAWQATDYG